MINCLVTYQKDNFGLIDDERPPGSLEKVCKIDFFIRNYDFIVAISGSARLIFALVIKNTISIFLISSN